MNHKDRLKKLERKINGYDGLTALLPEWLYDGNQPAARPGEKIIKPSGYLAFDEIKGEVYFHD